MRLDQFSGILAFLKVAETRSFSRAAAELGVTPPSLSEAVKGLEARLGVRLLNRTTRSVGLTEAGAAYLQRVRPAAEEIQAAGMTLRDAGDRPAGTLRLSLPWIGAPLIAEPLMGPFLAACPDVKLDFVFDDGFVDIVAEGFDAGVRIGELLEKDMIAVRISGPLRMAVFASPAYLAEREAPGHPKDLASHRCVAYRFASTGVISPWEFRERGREIMFTPEPSLSANTVSLMVEAAVQGLGVTYAAEGLAAKHVREGTLVKLLEPFCAVFEPLHLYYPSRRLTPPKLKALVEFWRQNRPLQQI
ncbi:LysR family transcriptional regulator [Mesorhizobium sp. NPDC059025]|uniref:LysR family transcriptional regulator n=1 Tax=unclassified Mesorhizobium TaxID=325217 RepID=UPI0036A16F33